MIIQIQIWVSPSLLGLIIVKEVDLDLASRRDYKPLHLFVFFAFFLFILSDAFDSLSVLHIFDISLPKLSTNKLPNIGNKHRLILHPFSVMDVSPYFLMPHFIKDYFLQFRHCLFVQCKIFLFGPFSEPKMPHHCWIWLVVEQNHQNFLAGKGTVHKLKPNSLDDDIQRRVIEISDFFMVQFLDGCDGSSHTVVKIR